ncbi:hypothetical protein [Thiorhodovibrio frisius]|uniref:Uncharacterized protein n=1 Tax=Thiorhodovibrio frisius TaxID=631362 RepID=H8YYW8_9GAMM|nr:hypothetical protein [Thiorhodovibrio frisius]EIC23644.1 hypothetical protein Thi970DRAFT_01325 [Thiorhodovibrio frisius]WPL23265.1 hypothetical protein Thiofri_03450 [Thiorhodovibrio frisius]
MTRSTGNLHGVVFDVIALAIGLAMISPAPDQLIPAEGSLLGAILLLAVVSQMAGAYWKAPALRGRLTDSPQPHPKWLQRALQGLLFLHWLFFTVVVLMAFVQLGWAAAVPGDSEIAWYWVLLSLALGSIATGLVRRSSRPFGAGKHEGTKPSSPANKTQEWLADSLLWLSMTILTILFWDSLIVTELEGVRGIGFGARSMTILVTSALLMLFLYLPSRYLFIVEDAADPLAWARIFAVVMVPIAWRIVL